MRSGVDATPPDPLEARGAALRPRWLWIAFALIALAVPILGLLLEGLR